ncbi:Host cell factor 2 [Tyrophagus putrescentiae]|nr:Host cell factor 2 [Tyrophagus putrescentiae]
MTAPLASYWRKVDFQYGSQPKPRHGHRAVTFKNDMVIFGGGNEGIIEEFSVFRHAEQRWFSMPVKGDVPPGCAAFGFTNDETRAWIFGGMLEYGKYSNELYELKLCNWECRRLKPRAPKNPNAQSPKARLGHSFNLIGNKIYLFGGLANDSPNPKQNLPKYLNDLYTLEIKANGNVPVGLAGYRRRASLSARITQRSGTLWILEIETLTWSKPYVNGIPPAPRSLHSANVIGEKMYIFGGWVPMLLNPDRPDAVQDKEWRCTNTVAVFDIPSNTWEYVSSEISDESAPKARAGHCAVSIGSRVMIFSGRDGYRKAWNNQVCCKDLWILETSKPAKPERIVLTKSGTSVLEITWGEVTEADKFLVQIQKVDPKEYEASVKELNEETTMSGIGVLAAAAAAQTPQKILATPIKGNPTAGAQRFATSHPGGGGGGANVKIPANLRLIANMPGGGGGAGAKLVLKSPAGGVGGLQSGTFTLVKTPQGMALANTGGGGTSTPQLLRVVSSSSSGGGGSQVTLTTNKSSTTSSSSSPLTTTISPVITGSGGTAKTGTATPNVRMIVVPQGGNGTPRLTGLQLAPGAKTQIRLVASPGAAGASSQRFVVLSAGQTPTTNTPSAAAVTSSTTKTSSSGGATTKTTNSTETILIDDSDATPTTAATAEQKEAPTSKPSSEMIPQTDGADDDDFSESTNSNNSNALSSSQQDSAIENAVASISSLEPPPPPPLLPRPTSPLLTPEHPLQSSEDESNSGDCELLPKPSTSSNSSTAAAAATTASSESSTATGTSATSADSAVNGNGSSSSGQQSTTTTTTEASKKKPPSQVKFLVPGDEQCLAAFNPDGDLTSTTILNYDNFDQVNLEPGVAYKIRVCGINTRGRGEWSEPCTLKTAQLGYPPPPSSIKITKVNNGVNISWTIPQSFSQNDVTDYSVYLGVNNESAANANAQAFQLVYQSAATTCFVSNETLAKAWTNPNPKPAILFRITARNAKGYGPATQIRWLQDAGKRPLPAAKVSDTPPSTKKNKS